MRQTFVITVLLFVSSLAGGELPLGLMPGAEDPVMSRMAPDECLVYLAWSGSTTPSSESNNEFEKLLAEPEVQFMLSEIERLFAAATDDPRVEDTASIQSTKWLGRFLSRPAAAFISKIQIGLDGIQIEGGLMATVGDDRDEFLKLCDKIRESAPESAIKEIDIDGATMYRVTVDSNIPAITLGIRGKYLVVGIGDGAVEGMIERAKNDPPKWLLSLRKQLAVDRVSVVTYLNAAALVEQTRQLLLGGDEGNAILEAIGIANLSHISSVSGLNDRAFVTNAIVGLKGDPTGLLAAAIGKPLTTADLRPIPRDSTIAVAARLDLSKMFDAAVATVAKFVPEAADEFRQDLGRAEEELGFRLRDDLLGGLGDVLCAYHSRGEGGLLAGWTAVASVRDHERLNRVLTRFNELTKRPERVGRHHHGPVFRSTVFDGQQIQFVTFVGEGIPYSPAWCLTENDVIFSLSVQGVKAYLARDQEYKSLADVPEVASVFREGNGPIKIVYQDTPAVFELVYPFIQMGISAASGGLRQQGIDMDVTMLPSGHTIKKHLKPDVMTVSKTSEGIELINRQCIPGSNSWVAIPPLVGVSSTRQGQRALNEIASFMFPSARLAAQRTQSSNNMRQLGLAFLNYEDVYRKLPPTYSVDENDKPLLSWRVHILPFTEDGRLYDQFRLDEPWDSEHNKKLVEQMPQIFKAPGSKVPPGRTNYLALRGKNTAFPGKQSTTLGQMIDGTSNTIGVVEVSDERAVIWTKPDDLEFDPMNPIKGIVGLREKGFLACFADSSVMMISEAIDKDSLRRLFEMNDRGRVNLNQFRLPR